MALAPARLSPSTVISTDVPRATPSGATELSVGGVVRLPAATSSIAEQAKRLAARLLRRDIVNLKVAIEKPRCKLVPGRRELQPEGPIRQPGNRADLGQIGGPKQLHATIGRRRGQQLPVRRPRQLQDGVFM